MKPQQKATKPKKAAKPRKKSIQQGGFLPALIPLIAAIVGGAGALASGGASIATAVKKAQNDAKMLEEAKRHHLAMEGKGLKKIRGQLVVAKGGPRRTGKGLFLKPPKAP